MSAGQNSRSAEKEMALLKAQMSEGDPAVKKALFEKTSELLLSDAPRFSDSEKTMMDDILVELIDQIEFSIRKKLAVRLAAQKTAPRKLLNTLMRDDISIARPILLNSGAPSDEDLVGVINATTGAHCQSVAARKQVSTDVSDALISTGDIKVIVTLLENAGACLSQQATTRLVGQSKSHEAIRAPLLSRSELRPQQAHAMFWWVSSALRGEILKNFRVDEEALDQALKEIVQEGVQEALDDQSILKQLDAVAADGGRSLSKFMAYLKGSSGAKLNANFARLLGISEGTANRILSDVAGDALAVCCKAIEADRQQFTRLFLLVDYKRFGQNRPIGHLKSVTSSYDAVSSQVARQTLRLWEVQELAKAA